MTCGMQHGGSVTQPAAAPATLAEIVAGSPATRSTDLTRSPDGRFTTNLWDCTAGTFRWHYTTDEVVHVLEGEVHVTAEDGSTQVLRAGDVGHFTKGTFAVWEVPEYVKKLAVHRHDTRWERWARRIRRVPAMLRGGSPVLVPALDALPIG